MLISSSSRYSIYKVQWSVLRSRSNFYILSHLQAFVKNFFEVFLTSAWFCDIRCLTAFQFYHTQNRLSSTFFVLFQTFWAVFFNRSANRNNFYMISHHIRFVKNFFHLFSTESSCFIILSPPLRTACIYYHRPNYLSSTLTKFLISFYRLHTKPPELTLRGWWLYYYI